MHELIKSNVRAAIADLIRSGCAMHVWNFFLEEIHPASWELMEVLSGWKDKNLSADIFLWRNKERPQEAVRYEVIEASSWKMADEVTAGFKARHMASYQLKEFLLDDKGHKSPIVQGARLAYIDQKEDVFRSLSVSYGNLSCRIESIGDDDTDLDELGELLPDQFMGYALFAGVNTLSEVRVSLSRDQIKPGEAVQVIPEYLNPSAGNIWWLFAADTPYGEFSRENDKLWFVPDARLENQTVTIYVAWFDKLLHSNVSEPLYLKIR